MASTSDGPEFEQVFGFRAPTPAEAEGAADDLKFKFANDGLPTGAMAFFKSDDLKRVSMEYIEILGTNFADQYGISDEDAVRMVYGGFLGALELMASVRLRVDE